MATRKLPRRSLARWCDNLATLAATDLLEVRARVLYEIARRTRLEVGVYDAAQLIRGQEAAKRAVTVAAAGGHSLFFFGPPNCGKSMLRAMALELGVTDTAEDWSCPCGNYNHPQIPCNCSVRQISRHRSKFPETDITVEVPPVPARGMALSQEYCASLADIRRQIKSAASHTDLTLTDDCRRLLREYADEYGVDLAIIARATAVARTIANLDHQAYIELPHLCEAINYRSRRT